MTLSQLHCKADGTVKEPATVMVVDDDSTIREMCETALKSYRVIKAGGCGEALRLYDPEKVDLVLTDVMMPDGTGIELLEQLKKVDPQVMVIVMTGFSEKKVILGALKAGAADFIAKPLSLLQVTTSVDKALAKKALQEELADLKKLDHLKSNFLSMISHKLRTPITAISLFLQNSQREIFQPDDAVYRQNLKLVSEEADYLSRMISDLLAFSQAMDGQERLLKEPTDLGMVIASALRSSREAQKKPGVETDFKDAGLPALNLDRPKISFALYQIIENAYKFSGESGTVAITLRQDGDKVCVTVADSGIGIAPDDAAKVFEKFYQVDPDATGQVRGFGLGLFYAREFIRQHGGGISLDSRPGSGTTVTVTLPVE